MVEACFVGCCRLNQPIGPDVGAAAGAGEGDPGVQGFELGEAQVEGCGAEQIGGSAFVHQVAPQGSVKALWTQDLHGSTLAGNGDLENDARGPS